MRGSVEESLVEEPEQTLLEAPDEPHAPIEALVTWLVRRPDESYIGIAVRKCRSVRSIGVRVASTAFTAREHDGMLEHNSPLIAMASMGTRPSVRAVSRVAEDVATRILSPLQ
jgi:hypothetical protein